MVVQSKHIDVSRSFDVKLLLDSNIRTAYLQQICNVFRSITFSTNSRLLIRACAVFVISRDGLRSDDIRRSWSSWVHCSRWKCNALLQRGQLACAFAGTVTESRRIIGRINWYCITLPPSQSINQSINQLIDLLSLANGVQHAVVPAMLSKTRWTEDCRLLSWCTKCCRPTELLRIPVPELMAVTRLTGSSAEETDEQAWTSQEFYHWTTQQRITTNLEQRPGTACDLFHLPRRNCCFQHFLWYWRFAQSAWDLLPFARARPMLTNGPSHFLQIRRTAGIRRGGFVKVLIDELRLACWSISLGRLEREDAGSREDDNVGTRVDQRKQREREQGENKDNTRVCR